MRKLTFWLSLVLIFLIPWEGALVIPALGSLTRVVGLLLAGVWVVSAALEKRFRQPHVFHGLLFLFILWNAASLIWTIDVGETKTQLITYVQLFMVAFILWDLYTTAKSLSMGLQAFVFGSWVAVGSTIFNFISGRQISLYEFGRFSSTGVNAADLALILSLSLPVAWQLVISKQIRLPGKLLLISNAVFIPAAIFAIVLTATRTALFTVGIALIYIFFSARNLGRIPRTVFFLISAAALVLLFSQIPASTFERLGTTEQSIETIDLGGRVALWKATLLTFLEYPVFGVGSGALSTVVGGFAHNTYLSVLAELGLIGFMLFGSIMAIVLFCVVRQPRDFRTLWIALLVIWSVGVMTLSWEFRKPTWIFLTWIVIGAGYLKESKPAMVSQTLFRHRAPGLLQAGSRRQGLSRR